MILESCTGKYATRLEVQPAGCEPGEVRIRYLKPERSDWLAMAVPLAALLSDGWRVAGVEDERETAV
jgi:hypothetical protein